MPELQERLFTEYREYKGWAIAVGTELMDVTEWYQQRDYDEGEPEIDPRSILCGCGGFDPCCPPSQCQCDGFQECVCGMTGAACAGVDA